MSIDFTVPSGWICASLKDVSEKIVDGSHNPPPKQPAGFPMLSARNILWGEVEFSNFRYISNEAFESEKRRADLRAGDVLLTIVGTIGRAAIVLDGMPKFALQRSVALVRPKGITPKFCMFQLLSERVQKWLREAARGSAQQGVYLKTLASLPFLIAPLDEQHRIVAEIEKQLTRLDAGVASLNRVQNALKRYRASVLKAACEGRLVPTEAELIRQSGKAEFKTVGTLLQGILYKRRKNWTGHGKYREPLAFDATKLWPLPGGWIWATIDALAEVKGGVTKDQNRKHTESARSIPYLRVANVQRGYLDLTEMKEIIASEEEIRELALKKGDILFNEGGDRDKLGRGWVWNGELSECIHQNHVFRARLHDTGVNPKLVSWYANTFGQKFFFDEGKHTTNLASISMTKLKGLPVPIPPPAEQMRIVAEVERRFSVVEELESVVTSNLKRAERLRQSILHIAFTGNL